MPDFRCTAVIQRASNYTKRGYASVSEKVRSPDIWLFYDTRLWLVTRGLVTRVRYVLVRYFA
jgi:hypothetical protein